MDSLTKLQAGWRRDKVQTLVAAAAFEDSPTRARVNEFCQLLTRNLGQNCELIKHLWLLNLLRLPSLRAVAAAEAAGADLILLSFHNPASLPDEVKDWMELGLGRLKRHRRRALVVFFDQVYGQDVIDMRPYLQTVARRGKMKLFLQSRPIAERPHL